MRDLNEMVKEAGISEEFFRNKFSRDLQKEITMRAKDKITMIETENALRLLKTEHKLILGDSRYLKQFLNEKVHLIVTSPPYWVIKPYRYIEGQLGVIKNYEDFHSELNKVWEQCYDLLEPGGRMCVVIGDACLPRRKYGRHEVVPIHADILINCRRIGFETLAPIIWHKIANVSLEVPRGRYLGKPYEPNGIIKHDIEYILLLRKPGYRKPSEMQRKLSIIPAWTHKEWFKQIWGIPGDSTKYHPAPFPLELAERLIRMFSFAGDTVLDPFVGRGTTNIAAMRWGRNSIGVEIDEEFFRYAKNWLQHEANKLFVNLKVSFEIANKC